MNPVLYGLIAGLICSGAIVVVIAAVAHYLALPGRYDPRRKR